MCVYVCAYVKSLSIYLSDHLGGFYNLLIMNNGTTHLRVKIFFSN